MWQIMAGQRAACWASCLRRRRTRPAGQLGQRSPPDPCGDLDAFGDHGVGERGRDGPDQREGGEHLSDQVRVDRVLHCLDRVRERCSPSVQAPRVPTRTSPRTRSGWSRAKCWATYPPLECPTTTARCTPTASRNAATSRLRSSREYPDGGSSASPCPRYVGRYAWIPAGKYGNAKSKKRCESAHGCRSTTGTPSASPCSPYGTCTAVASRAHDTVPATHTTPRPTGPASASSTKPAAHGQRQSRALFDGLAA
jgi:hypothetical protein